MTLTRDELELAARLWLDWDSESKEVSIAEVAARGNLLIEVVRANVADITARVCFMRAEDAERSRKLRIRIQAAKRGGRDKR